MIREIWMKHKLVIGVIAGIAVLAGAGIVQNQQGGSAESGEKMQALNSALKNGLITENEYNSKVKSLKGGGHVTGASATGSGGVREMKTVEVLDPLFGQRAYTLTIPVDWKFEGTVLWTPIPNTLESCVVFRTSSPDDLTGVQMLPKYTWEWSDDPGFQKAIQAGSAKGFKPLPAGEFVKKAVLAEARPGAQVEAVEPIPEENEKIQEQNRKANEQLAATAAQSHTGASHVSGNTERVRIRYEFRGHPEEEWLAAVISTQEFPTIPSPTRLIPALPAHSISHAWVTGARAPQGQLDRSEKLFVGIIKSLTPDPTWQQKAQAFTMEQFQKQIQKQMANHRTQLQQFNANMMKQHQAFMASQQAKFQASMNSAKAMSDASHASAMATAEHMGDVQSMVDPATGRTGQVSNQYNYSYANQDGSVVQTNSPTFNPNAQLRGNWTQLEPIKPQ